MYHDAHLSGATQLLDAGQSDALQAELDAANVVDEKSVAPDEDTPALSEPKLPATETEQPEHVAPAVEESEADGGANADVPSPVVDTGAEVRPPEEEADMGETQLPNPTAALFDEEGDDQSSAEAPVKEEEEAAHDLFGDDDDVEEAAAAVSDDATLEEAQDEQGGQYDLADFEGSEDMVTLPVAPPAPHPPSKDLWLFGLPLSVNVDYEPFDEAEFSRQEQAASSNVERRALRQALSVDTIRVKEKADGSLQSNARLVEFTDGTCSLYIGDRLYDADARQPHAPLLLVETSQSPLYHVHGTIHQRRIFKPPTVAALEAKTVKTSGAKKMKLTTVQMGAESEMRLKRHLEEMASSSAAAAAEVDRKSKQRRCAPLDANFLESD